MARKKKSAAAKRKTKQINKELNDFIKRHKSQIINKGRADLGSDLTDKEIVNFFKSNYRERMEDKKKTLGNAREAMKKTLHTETFTGVKEIDFENIKKSLSKAGLWEDFRTLNRHQKIDLDKFNKATAPSGKNIKKRWTYETPTKTIIIDLYYHDDGGYSYSVHL